MSARPLVVASLAVALVAAGAGLRLATRDAPPAAPATAAAPAPATAAAAPPALPARVPGYRTGPIELTSYRLSLVFRTRNALLNGLGGGAGAYAIETARADRGGARGLLIGVAVRPGTTAPPLGADIDRVAGGAPGERLHVAGRAISLHRGPGYRLAAVAGGPRRAVVVIATDRRRALALASAVARGMRAGPDPSGRG